MGGGSFPSLQHSDIPIWFPFIPFIFTLFQTLLYFFAPAKNSSLLFSSNSELFAKTPGGWEGQFDVYPSLPSARAESRSQPPLRLRLRELCVLRGLCVNSDSLLDFQLSTVDRRSRPCRDCQPPLRSSSTGHGTHQSLPSPRSPVLSSIRTRDIPL